MILGTQEMEKVTNSKFESVYDNLEESSDAEVQELHDKFVRDEEYEIANFIMQYGKSRRIAINPTK